MKKDEDDYIVLFKGSKLSKREANKVGLSIIFGLIGIAVSFLITGLKNSLVDIVIILAFVLVGYFVVGNKIFKR